MSDDDDDIEDIEADEYEGDEAHIIDFNGGVLVFPFGLAKFAKDCECQIFEVNFNTGAIRLGEKGRQWKNYSRTDRPSSVINLKPGENAGDDITGDVS